MFFKIRLWKKIYNNYSVCYYFKYIYIIIYDKRNMLVHESETQEFASKIGLSSEELIRQGLLSFVWKKLQEAKTQIIEIQKKYNIETVHDFDTLYENGKIEEADSWEDVQRFDRLTFELELYEDFLKKMI